MAKKKKPSKRAAHAKVAKSGVRALLKLHEAQGWKVSELARFCEVSPGAARNWINGQSLPTKAALATIARLLQQHNVAVPQAVKKHLNGALAPSSPPTQGQVRSFVLDVYAPGYTDEEVIAHIASSVGDAADVRVLVRRRFASGPHKPRVSPLEDALKTMVRDEVRGTLREILNP